MSEEKKEIDLVWTAAGGQQWLLYSADHKAIHGGVIQVAGIFPARQCYIAFAPPSRCELLFPCTWSKACELVEQWRAENAAEHEKRRGQVYEGEGVRVEQVERAFLPDRGRDGSNG